MTRNKLKKKIILNKTKLQVFSQKNFNPSQEIMDDPSGWWASLTPAMRRVCAYLVGMGNRYEIFYPSQSYALSRNAKCTRRTVYTAIKRLEADGIIERICLSNSAAYFRLTPWLYHKEVRQQFEKFMKACCYVPLFIPFVLLSTYYMVQAQQPEDCPSKKTFYKRYSNSESICSKKDYLFSKRSNVSTEKNHLSSKNTPADPRTAQWLTPGVRRIAKIFPLTKAGALSLTVFPDSVLDACLEITRDRTQSINAQAFKEFYEQCIQYARQTKCVLHWHRYYRLRDEYKISPQAYKIDYYHPFLSGYKHNTSAKQSSRSKKPARCIPHKEKPTNGMGHDTSAAESRHVIEKEIEKYTYLIDNPPAAAHTNPWLLNLARSCLKTAHYKLEQIDKESANE